MTQNWPPPLKGGPPICQDCRHNDAGYSTCNHPHNTKFDPVTGWHGHMNAYTMRSRGQCGPLGTLFEAKVASRWARFKASWNRA